MKMSIVILCVTFNFFTCIYTRKL